MSILENPKIVSKKNFKFRKCDDNAAETKKEAKKSVTIKFFGVFSDKKMSNFVSTFSSDFKTFLRQK